jgi:hypothetical protein
MKNIFEVETIKHDLGLSEEESAEFEMWVEEQEAKIDEERKNETEDEYYARIAPDMDDYDYPVSHHNWVGGCEWAR